MINVRETNTVNTRPKARSFKCYATQVGVGGYQLFREKALGVRFNVISVTRGSNFRGKSVRPTDTYPNPGLGLTHVMTQNRIP